MLTSLSTLHVWSISLAQSSLSLEFKFRVKFHENGHTRPQALHDVRRDGALPTLTSWVLLARVPTDAQSYGLRLPSVLAYSEISGKKELQKHYLQMF